MTELLLGCGHSRQKRLCVGSTPDLEWKNLYTLDDNIGCDPDFLCNLDAPEWYIRDCRSPSDKFWKFLEEGSSNERHRYQFKENIFDEVHAYEVLEHLGRQGDFKSFFSTFENIYRILKPDGFLFATCPSRHGAWAWGDPGHTRIISQESLHFLSQSSYEECGKTTMSDYRFCYKADFRIVGLSDDKTTFTFILQALKP